MFLLEAEFQLCKGRKGNYIFDFYQILPYFDIIFNSKSKKYGEFMDYLLKFINYLHATKNLSNKTLKAINKSKSAASRTNVLFANGERWL